MDTLEFSIKNINPDDFFHWLEDCIREKHNIELVSFNSRIENDALMVDSNYGGFTSEAIITFDGYKFPDCAQIKVHLPWRTEPHKKYIVLLLLEIAKAYPDTLTPITKCIESKFPEYFDNTIDRTNRVHVWKGIVPNKGDDWRILEMWEKGYQAPQIALTLNKESTTINNRLCILRNKYPGAKIENRKKERQV